MLVQTAQLFTKLLTQQHTVDVLVQTAQLFTKPLTQQDMVDMFMQKSTTVHKASHAAGHGRYVHAKKHNCSQNLSPSSAAQNRR